MSAVSGRLIVDLILEARQRGYLDGLMCAESLPLSGEGEGNAAHLRDSIRLEIAEFINARRETKST